MSINADVSEALHAVDADLASPLVGRPPQHRHAHHLLHHHHHHGHHHGHHGALHGAAAASAAAAAVIVPAAPSVTSADEFRPFRNASTLALDVLAFCAYIAVLMAVAINYTGLEHYHYALLIATLVHSAYFVVAMILEMVVHQRHRRYRQHGYLQFVRTIVRLRRIPFLTLTVGNLVTIIVVALWPSSWHTETFHSVYLLLGLYGAEGIVVLVGFSWYHQRVRRHNKNRRAPDDTSPIFQLSNFATWIAKQHSNEALRKRMVAQCDMVYYLQGQVFHKNRKLVELTNSAGRLTEAAEFENLREGKERELRDARVELDLLQTEITRMSTDFDRLGVELESLNSDEADLKRRMTQLNEADLAQRQMMSTLRSSLEEQRALVAERQSRLAELQAAAQAIRRQIFDFEQNHDEQMQLLAQLRGDRDHEQGLVNSLNHEYVRLTNRKEGS